MHLPYDKIDLFTYSHDLFNEDVLTEPKSLFWAVQSRN